MNIKKHRGFTNQPKTKEELKALIEATIDEQGNNCDLNFIDTSLITNMTSVFEGSQFKGDLSKWDVSNVEDMKYMFKNCPLENNPPAWYK